MVVSKDGKRRRKVTPTLDLSRDLSPEEPKRPKVHAQRKFAQGQGASSSAYLNFTSSPAPATSAKDTQSQLVDTNAAELLPNVRPNTDDFLTFLCFRGTPVLPPNLDFFNSASSSSRISNSASGSLAVATAANAEQIETKAEAPDVKGKAKEEKTKPAESSPEKPTYMPFAVRKRAEQYPDTRIDRKRFQVQTVQALRKKYHDQRMAKLRATAFSKQSRASSLKSRYIDELAETGKEDKTKKVVENKKTKEQKKPTGKVAQTKRKIGLRSAAPPTNAELKAMKKSAKLGKATCKSSKSKEMQDQIIDVKIILNKEDVEMQSLDSQNKKKKSDINKTENPKQNVKKEKELTKKPVDVEADDNEKRTTRLSALRHPASAQPSLNPPAATLEKKSDVETEFSSDDDQPLAKAVAVKHPIADDNKAQPALKKTRKSAPAGTTNDKTPEKIMRRSESASRRSDISSKLSEFVKSPKRTNLKQKKTKKELIEEIKVNDSPEADTKEISIVEEKEPIKIPLKRGRKKKQPVDDKVIEKREEMAAPIVDVNENDAKIGRPSRKTKEAATLYMELIGRRLNLDEQSDDDASSLDSLELPNVRKMQQMENEIKANATKKDDEKMIKSPPKPKIQKEKQKKKVIELKSEEKKVEKCEKIPLLNEKALEKSFSDSDEEPLAAKLFLKKKKQNLKTRTNKSVPVLKEVPIEIEEILANIQPKILEKTPEKIADIRQEPETVALLIKEKISPIASEVKLVPTLPKFPSPMEAPPCYPSPDILNKTLGTDDMSSTKVNKSVEKDVVPINNTAEKTAVVVKPVPFTRTMKAPQNSVDLTVDKTQVQGIPFNRNVKSDFLGENRNFLKAFEQILPQTAAVQPKANSLLGNLLPSKEESEKIFGIASVSLAQSSGPLDTKCTLGKCGSVHKPPLGPPVLTESLLGGHLSPRDRRKTKVNMTHEQIQKWLDETSWSPVPDDLDNEMKNSPKPENKITGHNLSSGWDKLELPATSSDNFDSKSIKKESEKTSTPTFGNRGPTLKAKPVVMKPEKEDTSSSFDTSKNQEKKHEEMSKIDVKPKEEIKLELSPSPAPTKKETKKSKHESKNELNAVDRKPYTIYQRRTPVYKPETPIPKTTKIQAKATNMNKFGAFSPENEPSVYSFDKEDDFIPAATPYRRHSRRESCSSSVRDDSTPVKKEIKEESNSSSTFQKPQNLATPSKTTPPQQVSLTLSPEDNSKSASITVPGSNSQDISEINKSPKTHQSEALTVANDNDSESEGHTFYIPLQGPNMSSGNKSDQLIQGVAVKLGTEGPEGPNQRVIMHAKLVTKAQMGSNTTPIPDSMANVQDLVKSLMAGGAGVSKEGISKSVPVGTVQPRFKSSDTNIAASTSEDRNVSASAEVRPGISRMNSNSSISTQKSKQPKNKFKADTQVQPDNNTAFPRRDDPPQMVEAPIFRPTEKEFQDPMEYIERITPVAARFGICRIIPPESFKPECRVVDDMRFMAYNQYVHKMLHRWGPSAKEYAAIKKYLATQSIVLQQPPLIGGMEVDLPRLYHTVQELGGLKEVIEKKKWARVSEDMCIPKSAHDRVTKLDDIYCKYLLPYDTLSPAERQKLFDEVEADWAKREAKARRNADKFISAENRSSEDSDGEDDGDECDDEEEEDEFSMECIMKGRTMPLNQFFRIARNTMSLWFKNSEPTVAEIESEYWRHVAVRDSHVCVHSGSIDSSAFGYGFPNPKVKGSSCSKHPWNLKVLTNNSGSILRSLGPVMGITIPTLHVGMLFSACCWYRDPHGLPWIEYLHTGANKLWYGVPDDQNSNFRTALTALVPTHCQNKTIWLPCDTAMVPPHMLTDRNVSLCRTEQQPGQFVVVFPRAYTSSLCTGYAVSESVYFATSSWLHTAKEDFHDIQESCEPTMFSVEQLLFAIASDQRSNHDTLVQTLPMINCIYDKEKAQRQQLKDLGVVKSEKLPESKRKSSSSEEFECDLCRANLYLSMIKVKDTTENIEDQSDEDDRIYCLKHSTKYLNENRIQAKHCKLIYTYSLEDVDSLLKKLQERISSKKFAKCNANKKQLASTSSQSSSSYQAPSHSKYAGMATMLK